MDESGPTKSSDIDTSQAEGGRGRIVVLAIGGLLAFALLLKPAFQTPKEGDHYLYLASHFVRGDLSVDTLPDNYQDVVVWQGHKYLPLGPLPGVVLIPALPFTGLGPSRVISWVGYLLTLLNIWLFYRVLGLAGVRCEVRLWALLLFFAGTVYLSAIAAGNSWYFAHILTTALLLCAIYETLGRGRAWLVGLMLGLACTTRITALFALPFFVWLFWKKQKGWNVPEEFADSNQSAPDHSHARPVAASPGFAFNMGILLLELTGPLALLFVYNYLRFGNGLESGYGHAVLTYPPLAQALDHGLFSLEHVPKNLFMLFLQGPLPYPHQNAPVLEFPFMRPSQWGMGIFFTSPALLYAFRANFKHPLAQACLLGIISIMVPLITYYGIGWIQFGYRYALDFMPLLLMLAALGLPRPLTRTAKALILASVVINIWGAIFLVTWV
ncbi:MAG TPA: hypothetical protein VJ183_04070 [Chloroflexia bacterium]|nr:hypothetical protein [Chloroflexia bacterium]